MFAIVSLSTRAFERAALLLCLAIPLGFGALALALGQDANWDLRNYHWYNPYAFLTGRLHTDFGAAAPYNPALDIPHYLGATLLPAKVFSFILGTIHGLNYVLLYFLGRAVLAPPTEPNRPSMAVGAAAAIAFIGIIGGGHIGLVGTSFHDNVVSLAVIGAMLIIARAPAEIFLERVQEKWKPVFRPDTRQNKDPERYGDSRISHPALGTSRRIYIRVGLAGLLLGIGVGLKQPTITFAVGLCFAFLLVAGTFWRRMFLAFWFGIGITAGIGLSCGFWMLHLWREFQNPLFPYFNNVFKSPLGLAASNRDTAFVPKTFLDMVIFPLRFSFDPRRVGEIEFRDFRILAAYLVLVATPVILYLRRKAPPAPALANRLAARYVIAAGALSYAVWVPLFGIYRYLIPLEMLAPLVTVAAIALWPVTAQLRATVAVGVLTFVTVTAWPGNWTRLPEWTEKMVEVGVPPLPDPARTMVLMVGLEPLSYVVPSLPPEVPVLRLQGYFTDPKDDTGVNRLIRARLKAHQGPFYLLSAAWDRNTVETVLPQFGLAADFSACGEVTSNIRPPPADGMRISLCPVTRTGADPGHP